MCNPIILITGYRNYNKFNRGISLASSDIYDQQDSLAKQIIHMSVNAGETGEPVIFGLIKLMVSKEHHNMVFTKKDEDECEEAINKITIMKNINKKLQTIGLICKIQLLDKRTWSYAFEFHDIKNDQIINNINLLSAGQKAMVHLIFEAYGRQHIKGGVIIIDEPEIHLHHQFQYEYLRIIRDIEKEQNCQYILATHSEAFITSDIIGSVFRFHLNNDNNTEINVLNRNIEVKSDDLKLLKMLDNFREYYVFFVKKVILVEGPYDRYYFRSIFNMLYPELVQDIAIIDLKGKGDYKKYKIFLESFGMSVYYIGDIDNILNLNKAGSSTDKIITQKEAKSIREEIEKESINNLTEKEVNEIKKSCDDMLTSGTLSITFLRDIKKLAGKIKVSNKNFLSGLKEKYENLIKREIKQLHKENIFILRNDLEHYTSHKKGNFNELVEFCESNLSQWIKANSSDALEIIEIYKHITEKASLFCKE